MATKWHPGHYFLTETDQESASIIHKIADKPNAIGLQTRYELSKLMPVAQGVYDWAPIDANLATHADAGKIHQIVLLDRREEHWPQWLIEKTEWHDIDPSNPSKLQLNVFLPDVQAFLKSIDAAFAERYDANPVLVAYIWQETAAVYMSGSREAYANYFIDRVSAAASQFNETPLIQFTNWGILDPLEVARLLDALATMPNVGCGGPDTVPQDSPCLTTSGNSESNNPFYPQIPLYSGLMPICYDVQWSQYCGKRTTYSEPGGCTFTPQELHEFCVDTLKSNMMVWKISSPSGCPTNFNSIVAYLDTVNWRINEALPDNCEPGVEPPAPIVRSNYGARPIIPGVIAAHAFDQRTQDGIEITSEGVTYHDETAGNSWNAHSRVLTDEIYPDVASVAGASQPWKLRQNRIGEWQEWTVDVPAGCTVIPRIEYTAPETPANPAVRVTLDGATIANLSLDSTGDWQTYAIAEGAPITLDAGTDLPLRVSYLSEGFDWTQIELAESVDTGGDPDPGPQPAQRQSRPERRYWSRPSGIRRKHDDWER